MIKTNIPRIITKQIRRLRIYYYLIVLIFLGTILFFYFQTTDSNQLINDFSTSKTEWSFSEHGAFFSWLIAKYGFNNTSIKKENNYDIKRILMSTQDRIKSDIKKKQKTTKKLSSNNFNLDFLEYNEVLELLTLDDKILQKLPLTSLNLLDVDKTPDYMMNPEENVKSKLKYSILRNDNSSSEKPKSFVFIPTQLIQKDENKQPQLSIQLKRELIFSKFMEKYLLEILKEFDEANQAYFIPISGFVRISQKNAIESIEYYRDKFRFKLDFADRLYFEPTMEEEFHTAPPYVDSGGAGIVRTYSIAVKSHKWGIVGMIGIDLQIDIPEDRLLSKSWTDIFFPKNPLIDIYSTEQNEGAINNGQFKTKYKLLTTKDIFGITQDLGDNLIPIPKDLTTKLNRFDFDRDGNVILYKNKKKDGKAELDKNKEPKKISRIIYTLPLAGEKLAIFIFDNKQYKRKNFFFILILGAILFVFTLLIYHMYMHMIKRVQEEEKKLDLITHMHSSYVITDKFNRIQACNQEFKNLVEDENAEGKKIKDFLTRDNFKDLTYFMDSGKERFEFPVLIKTKSGDEKPAILISTLTTYQFDSKARISIIIESENLESKVAEKYADRISHILKSPLHSILQIADQMRRKTAKPRYEEYFKILEFEIKGLRGEISRLLGMLKVEYKQPSPEFKKFDLTKLVKEIKEEYIPLVQKKKLGFNSNFADGVSFGADRSIIKITIENLLDNALKYTPTGSISFHLFDSPKEVKIVVEDTGIGIPPGEIDQIFLKNHRVIHPDVLKAPGKGLGLFYCKNFIDLHKGQIEVESAVEKGTKFTVLIPKNLKENRGE